MKNHNSTNYNYRKGVLPMHKITKKIWKLFFALVFVLTVSNMDSSVVQAKEYKVEGVWKGKIDGTTYYLEFKKYNYKNKYKGELMIYEGYKNYKESNINEDAQYRKYKNNNYVNKYYVKLGNGATMSMKVSSKKIKLKQLKGNVDGVKFNGTFKLVKKISGRSFS